MHRKKIKQFPNLILFLCYCSGGGKRNFLEKTGTGRKWPMPRPGLLGGVVQRAPRPQPGPEPRIWPTRRPPSPACILAVHPIGRRRRFPRGIRGRKIPPPRNPRPIHLPPTVILSLFSLPPLPYATTRERRTVATGGRCCCEEARWSARSLRVSAAPSRPLAVASMACACSPLSRGSRWRQQRST